MEVTVETDQGTVTFNVFGNITGIFVDKVRYAFHVTMDGKRFERKLVKAK